jgi:hypothetical protein
MVAMQAPEAPATRVLDWNSFDLGRVRGQHRDPHTHAVDAIVVRLSPEARAVLQAGAQDIVVPVQRVFGVRREEIILDCSVKALVAAMPKPIRA